MNLNHVEAVGLLQKLAWTLEDKKHDPDKSEVVVLPPFTDLRTVQTLVDGDRLEIGYGAQDVSAFDNGAYTGDISADMLAKLGCRYVVVGHSERRRFHGEDDNIVNAKTLKAVSRGIVPIVCVGEGLAVREQFRQVPDTLHHVEGALVGLTSQQVGKLVVAYEPVWAIGTGRAATAADANGGNGVIRQELRSMLGDEVARTTRVQYGGSVTPDNAAELLGQPEVDGALVGGASLKAESFAAIVRAASGR
jgi:triosephosphate isomerase (TIM)